MINEITELQAIAQSGLAYCKDVFDIARYKRILEISAKLLALKSDHKYEQILELFTADKGYATPKIDVRGAVFKEDKVLLVQEKADDLWSLPGGWADVNLSPAENIIKEIYEEAGFQTNVIKLVGIFDKRKHNPTGQWPHVYKLFFLCSLIKPGQLAFDKNEILNVNFFKVTELPALSEERVTKKQIEICFKHFHNQDLMVEFD